MGMDTNFRRIQIDSRLTVRRGSWQIMEQKAFR